MYNMIQRCTVCFYNLSMQHVCFLRNIVGNTYKYINCKYKLSQGMLSNFNIPRILIYVLRFSYATGFNSHCPIVWYIMHFFTVVFVHKSLTFVLLFFWVIVTFPRDEPIGLPSMTSYGGYIMPSRWFDAILKHIRCCVSSTTLLARQMWL